MEAVRVKLWGVVEGLDIFGGDSPIELVIEYGIHRDHLTIVEGQRTTIHYPAERKGESRGAHTDNQA